MASHTSGVETWCDNHSGMTTIGFLRVEEFPDHLLDDGNSGATFAMYTIMIIDPPVTKKTADSQTPQARQQTRNRPQNMVPAQYRVSRTYGVPRHRTTRPRTRHWLVCGSNEICLESSVLGPALPSRVRVTWPSSLRGVSRRLPTAARLSTHSRSRDRPCARRLQNEDRDVPRLDSGRPHARRTRQARDPLQAYFSEPVQRNKFRLCTAVRNCGLLPAHPRSGNHRV